MKIENLVIRDGILFYTISYANGKYKDILYVMKWLSCLNKIEMMCYEGFLKTKFHKRIYFEEFSIGD